MSEEISKSPLGLCLRLKCPEYYGKHSMPWEHPCHQPFCRLETWISSDRDRRQAIIWNNDGLGWWHMYAPLGLNEFTHSSGTFFIITSPSAFCNMSIFRKMILHSDILDDTFWYFRVTENLNPKLVEKNETFQCSSYLISKKPRPRWPIISSICMTMLAV